MTVPYTYRIGWTSTGMYYYGVRYAIGCHPNDLWVTYFTSSTYVAAYVNEHGQPDLIEIRKVFTKEHIRTARIWEHRVLKKLGAVERSDYINKHDGNDKLFTDWSDSAVRERHKQAIHDKWSDQKFLAFFKNIINSPETKEKQKTANKEINSRPDVIERKRSIGKLLWEDSEYRNKCSGPNHGRYDTKIYHFINDNGVVEHCTKRKLIEKYDLSASHVYNVINGERKSHRGWRLKSH